MVWVLVAIAEGNEGEKFTGLREGEIGIGHECALTVALSRSPIVAELGDVVGLLAQYHRADGRLALSYAPYRDDAAAVAQFHKPGALDGTAHGLEWAVLDAPADEMAAYPWFDQDARSIYLAAEVLAGRLTGATHEERDLAVSWTAYAERLVEDRPWFGRPWFGLREAPERAEERAYIDELRVALTRVTGRKPWYRLGERHHLCDGTTLVIEQRRADGGWYVGCYVVSRYRDKNPAPVERSGARRRRGRESVHIAHELIERTYL
jgi:hypothetical protein